MYRRIDLNGAWQLRWSNGQRGDRLTRLTPADADTSRAIPAAVPGEVHLDLMRAGIIAEPGVGLNCLSARWVEEFVWFYRREFNAPRLRADQRVFLVFQTLDLAAVVHLNGQEVGRHANAFYPCRIDVTGKVRPARNVLVVQLESGLYHAADRPSEGYHVGLDGRLTKRHWLRQTQSSFGWDWSERLLNVGIRGDACLEVCSSARLDGLAVLSELSDDLKRGTVRARMFVEGLDDKTRSGTLSVAVDQTRQRAQADVQVKPGLNLLEARVALDSPLLWWPVGHGDQPLYTVRATLRVEGRVVASASRRIGFRHVRVNQSPHPRSGRYFVLEVNHKPIFCKGGNFVPADLILARLDRRRYETLIRRALEANANFLRVWGGGLYESDDFYDLCDRSGVMVWQEFIFACAKYPAHDAGFHNEAMKEAAHQVRRLAHHPSLVIWCGNNELEMLYGQQDRQVSPAYPDTALFDLVLPTIVRREDGTRMYWPSSPHSPDLEAPNADHLGDQHPWSIGFADTDFRKYRRMSCRFPNEGGILGATALPTVRACLGKGQDRPGSLAWEIHDNSVNYWGDRPYADDMLRQWLGLSVERMSLEDYVYYAGVVQGEGLSVYIGNFRRRMFDTASAIFWMYNDCWPMVRSWTIVDYYLRRTPAFHPVRRAFGPLAVVLAQEGERIRVFGVNEGPAWKGTVRYGVFALSGGLPLEESGTVQLPANAAAPVGEFGTSQLTRRGERTHGAFAILYEGRREVARDRLLLPFFKDMDWPKAKVAVRRRAGQAVFQCRTFAWRVCLDLDGEKPLPDNFFDVLPGIPTVVDWPERLGQPKILRVGNLVR